MKKHFRAKELAFYALSISIGLILSYVEAILPLSIGIPGAKLGLPNVVTVTLLYTAGARAACLVALLRILLNGFMFGNLFAILYSMAGFILSFAGMLLLKKSGRFGLLGVSVAGGVLHNAGQLMMACLLTNGYVLSYLPVLAAAGTVAGIVIGILSARMAKRVRKLLPGPDCFD